MPTDKYITISSHLNLQAYIADIQFISMWKETRFCNNTEINAHWVTEKDRRLKDAYGGGFRST